MTKTANQPAATLRDGSLKVVIWANPSPKGKRYSVELIRSYKDEQGKWHDTSYLSNGEILRSSRLLTLAYDRIQSLRAIETATLASVVAR